MTKVDLMNIEVKFLGLQVYFGIRNTSFPSSHVSQEKLNLFVPKSYTKYVASCSSLLPFIFLSLVSPPPLRSWAAWLQQLAFTEL